MRPLSVTIVGWWLIVTSLFGVYSSATMHMNPVAAQLAAGSTVPLQVQEAFGIINGFVLAICGIAILKGRGWSRLLFVGWSLIGFFFGVATVGLFFALLMTAISVGVIMFFLCRAPANYFFANAA